MFHSKQIEKFISKVQSKLGAVSYELNGSSAPVEVRMFLEKSQFKKNFNNF